MSDRRWTTQELRQANKQGATIRAWSGTSVRWDPRRPRDPQPWEGVDDVRYAARECRPENPDGTPWQGGTES